MTITTDTTTTNTTAPTTDPRADRNAVAGATPTVADGDDVTAAVLRSLRAAETEVCLVDVRTGAEYGTAHIADSVHLPIAQLTERAEEVAAVDRRMVLVCQSGARARTAAGALRRHGKTDVHVLDGGIVAWQSAGGDVVEGEAKWALERQVRGVAGSIVLTSILASLVRPGARFVAGGVGFGLLFSAVSNTCAMGSLLSKLPYNRGPRCDVDGALSRLRD